MHEILIDKGARGLRSAKCRSGRVVQFDYEFEDLPPLQQDAIYLGKVVDILKGGQMAFVDIGLDLPGILPLQERKLPPLTRGETVLCQVVREGDPQENKGVHLSRNVTLALGPVLYTPLTPGFNLSKKLGDKELAEAIGQDIQPDEGVVLRHWAAKYDLETLQRILEMLRQHWVGIQSKPQTNPPACLKPPPHLLEKIVHQIEPGDSFLTNHKPTAVVLEKLLMDHFGGGPEIEVLRESAFDDNIEDQWDSLTATHIPVPDGGELVIEETAALVSIDINSGGSSAPSHDLNRRALKEIFHQIHLRNLAGIIIVDLAGNIKHPKQLIQSARSLADSGTHVHGITHLGLLEVSRRKSGPSLTQILKE